MNIMTASNISREYLNLQNNTYQIKGCSRWVDVEGLKEELKRHMELKCLDETTYDVFMELLK